MPNQGNKKSLMQCENCSTDLEGNTQTEHQNGWTQDTINSQQNWGFNQEEHWHGSHGQSDSVTVRNDEAIRVCPRAFPVRLSRKVSTIWAESWCDGKGLVHPIPMTIASTNEFPGGNAASAAITAFTLLIPGLPPDYGTRQQGLAPIQSQRHWWFHTANCLQRLYSCSHLRSLYNSLDSVCSVVFFSACPFSLGFPMHWLCVCRWVFEEDRKGSDWVRCTKERAAENCNRLTFSEANSWPAISHNYSMWLWRFESVEGKKWVPCSRLWWGRPLMSGDKAVFKMHSDGGALLISAALHNPKYARAHSW